MTFDHSINGLRGFASLAVVLFHIWAGAIDGGFFPSQSIFVQAAAMTFQYGVELFFMISGYLISQSIVRHGNVRSFLVDRARRIYPAYLPPILLIFVLGPVAGYDYFQGVNATGWIGLLVANLLFLPGIFPVQSALLVAWTLSYEAAFYLFGAAAFSLSRIASRAVVTVIVVGACAVLIVFYPRACFLALGALIYFAKGGLERAGPACGFLGVPALVVLVTALTVFDIAQPASWRIFSLGAAVVSGGILFVGLVFQMGPFARLLRAAPFQWLGAISYSLYLWHTPIMFGTKKIAMRVAEWDWAVLVVFGLLSLAVALPISWLSYMLLEKRTPPSDVLALLKNSVVGTAGRSARSRST